jgi:hypothetical protein
VSVLPALLGALPSLLFWSVVGVVAAARWPRHPTVSALVVTGAALHALASAVGTVLPVTLHQQGVEVTRIGIIMSALQLFHFSASLCLVVAVFIGRQDDRAQSVSPRS